MGGSLEGGLPEYEAEDVCWCAPSSSGGSLVLFLSAALSAVS